MKVGSGSVFCGGILALASLGACASFRVDRIETGSEWPPGLLTGTPSIRVEVSAEVTVNGEGKAVPNELLDLWREETLETYRDSGLFSEVTGDRRDTDRRAVVRIVDRGRSNQIAAYLTGMTLLLVPHKLTDEFVVTTGIEDERWNTVGRFRKSARLDTWVHLFMIFAMPFRSPGSVEMNTLSELNRATIREAHAQRAFFVLPRQ